jgi:hypothetical protein
MRFPVLLLVSLCASCGRSPMLDKSPGHDPSGDAQVDADADSIRDSAARMDTGRDTWPARCQGSKRPLGCPCTSYYDCAEGGCLSDDRFGSDSCQKATSGTCQRWSSSRGVCICISESGYFGLRCYD